MEEQPLTPGQAVSPQATGSLDGTGANMPVSSYSAAAKQYPLESLEVHSEGGQSGAGGQAPQSQRSVPYSRRRATVVSLVITLLVLLITAAAAAFIVDRSTPPEDISSQLNVPEQDVSVGELGVSLPELQGEDNALLVNGDVIARGDLKVVSDDFTYSIQAGDLSANQVLTLPNSSGTLCLDNNNCNFATQDQIAAEVAETTQQAAELAAQAADIAALQAQLAQIVIPPAGVTSLNNFAGAVAIQGTPNQVIVNAAGGTITLATPQDLATLSSPTFAGLTLNGSLNLTGAVTLPLDCTGFTNDGKLTTNAGGQIICGNDVGGGGGGAPADAEYLVVSLNPGLSDERALQAGANIAFTDGGANGNFTVATVQNPVFGTSVTTPLLTSTGTLDITSGGDLTVGTAGQSTFLNGQTISASSAVGNISLTSANMVLLDGSSIELNANTNLTGNLAVTGTATITALGAADTDTVLCHNSSNQLATCNSTFATTTDLNGYVELQGATPGTAQAGHINVTGTIIADSFSGNGANLTDLNASALATGTVDNARLVNGGALDVTAGTGLSGGGSVALGGSTSLDVLYGATAGTAVQGDTALTCPSGTGNLTGGGDAITLGSGGTCSNLNTVDNPTFATSVTTPSLILTGVGSNGTLEVASLGQATTYTLPDPGQATADICLSTGNCAGTGGGVTTVGGTTNTIALFTGSQSIGDSLITQSGSVIDIAGSLTLDTQLAVAEGGTGAASFTANGVLYGNGTSAVQATAAPTAGQVLLGNGAGVPTFTTFSGDITVSGTGVTTLQPNSVALGTDTTGDYVSNLGALTGLSTTGNSGEGSTPTLSVLYGSAANTAVQGNTTLTCASGAGNLTGGGNSVTLGGGGACSDLTIVDDPTFATSVTTPAVILTGLGSNGTLEVASLGQATTFTLPDPGQATATICLTTGNCAGAGGGVTTGGGTTDRIAKFTSGNNIEDSSISDDGSLVTVNGNVNLEVQGTNVTVGAGGARTGSIVLHNSTNTNTVSLESGVTGTSYALTLPTAVGAANQCLKAQDGTGTLFWDDCLGGGGGSGITSVNGQTGPGITINNASGAGNAITIDDASTTQKGIAQFNATNFTAAGGVINTIQDIDTGATPTFAGLTLNGTLNMGANDIQGTNFSVDGSTGNVTSGLINGQTISSTANFTGTLSVATSVTTPQLILTGAGSNGTLEIANLGQATTYTLPDPGQTTADICLSTGNCAGSGGGITGSGTNNTVAKFTGSGTIGDSSITDDGATVGIGANTSITGTLGASGNINTSGGALQTAGTTRIDNGGNLTNINNATVGGSLTVSTLGSADTDTVLCHNSSSQLATCNSTFATTDDLDGYVQLQPSTPGTQQTGHLNISGTGILGTSLQTPLVNGGTTQGDVLTLQGSDQGWSSTTPNTVEVADSRLRFTGQNTIAQNDFASLLLFDETVDATGTSVAGLTGFSFSPTIQYDTSQVFSSYPAFNANPKFNVMAGGLNDGGGTLFGGYASSPTLTVNNSGAAGASSSLYGYTSSPILNRAGGQTGTHTTANVTSYAANQGVLGGSHVSGGNTVTTWRGFHVKNPTIGTGGSIVNNVGLDVNALSGGSNSNVGVRIAQPSGTGAVALSLSGTGGTTASGIQFGGDTDLYRNGANALAISGTLSVATSVTTPQLTLTGAGSNGTLEIANLGQATTYTLPDPGQTTADICLSTGNCAGSGGGITGSGTNNTVAKFTGSGTIGDSSITDDGATVGIGANTNITGTIDASGNINTSGGALQTAGTTRIDNTGNLVNIVNGTLSGDLAVNGGDITSTGALNITPGGALTVGATGQALTLQGSAASTLTATDSGFTTTVGFATPTDDVTLNFPALSAGTYNICTSSGNCAGPSVTLQAAYDNSSNPEIVVDATRGALTVRDAATPLGANLLEVQSNDGATTYLAVTANGIDVTGTTTSSGNINSSGGSLQTGGTTRIDNSGNATNIGTLEVGGLATFNGGLTIETGDTFTFNGDAFTDLIGSGLQISGGSLQTTLGTSVDLTSEVNGILPIANGGTGASTAQGAINNISGLTTAGDLLYHNGSDTVRLARGTDGQCLTSSATTILWSDCGGGVTTVGTLDSETKSADGAVINGSSLVLQTADDSFPGLVSTGTQTLAGAKTFNGAVTAAAAGTGLSVTNNAIIGGDLTVDTNSLFVDASTDRVGFGTASPDTRLHVKQSAQGETHGVRVENSGTQGTVDVIDLYYEGGNVPVLYMGGSYQIGHLGGSTSGGALSAGRELTLSSYNDSNLGGIVFDFTDTPFGTVEAGRFDFDNSTGEHGFFLEGWLSLGVQDFDIPDSGDASPAVVSDFDPLSSYIELTCSDADGCQVTMNDTANSSQGQTVFIVNEGTNTIEFADDGAAQELQGTCTLHQYDTLSMTRGLADDSTGLWIEYSRTNNSGSGTPNCA